MADITTSIQIVLVVMHFKVPFIKSDELKSILKSPNPNKSTGIDGISQKMLKLASATHY